MSNHLDRDDLSAVARGEERALRALYRRHADKVFRFALRFARCEALAEEIVNDAFLELWRKADQFRGDSALSTWLLTIARNKAVDRLRRRREEPLDEVAASRIADEAATPEERLVIDDRTARLRRLIERLSPMHREIIDLVYYQEQSISQAAQILGIPEGTVKTRMFAARGQLARHLEQTGLREAFV